MSAQEGNLSQNWKRPDELIKLQRLKLRKKQLTARFGGNNPPIPLEVDKTSLLEAKVAQKRKNPFARGTDNAKKAKQDGCAELEIEDSLLSFVNEAWDAKTKETAMPETTSHPPAARLVLQPFDARAFSKLLRQSSGSVSSVAGEEDDAVLEEQQFSDHLPMDWSLKTRVRFFSRCELPATALKTSQLASGLTSFVRCIGTQDSCSSLDISPASRFNQATYFWQHPHLPWMTLYPRNAKENSGITLGEKERKSLAEEWDYSFRGLFQLLRARQCPYFYLCANTFTVLFRAAGTGGLAETHALMSPSTRGMRSALRQEGIEYTMPLKEAGLNRSGESNLTEDCSSVPCGTENGVKEKRLNDVSPHDTGNEVDDEVEEEEWLESLGVDEKEIRKIQTAHTRKEKAKEMSEDFCDNSLLLIEGVECQGFFSFLLNARSTISSVGRLAGVPPTLLSTVAFPKATMQHLATRSSKVRMDGTDYCSIEVKGTVLPTFLPYVCQLLSETKDAFSATLASSNSTLAFSKATQKLLEEPRPTNGEQQAAQDDEIAGQVFGQENLSDCGLLPDVIESICRREQKAVSLLERVCYDKNCGYAWS